MEKVVTPYREGEDLFIKGKNISANDIDRIHILKSELPIASLAELVRREQRERDRNSSVVFIGGPLPSELAVWRGQDVLDDYISGPPGYEVKARKPSNNEALLKPQEDNKIPNKIFLVHGQNEEMKQSVARFIEKLGIDIIILHEQANLGRTIIEKFTDYSDVNYAIVLLSADDVAYSKRDSTKTERLRARQNVILELGFFLGKIGRRNVVSLYEATDNIEIPSDYQGVIFIPYASGHGWQMDLIRELKASGFEIDANKII